MNNRITEIQCIEEVGTMCDPSVSPETPIMQFNKDNHDENEEEIHDFAIIKGKGSYTLALFHAF